MSTRLTRQLFISTASSPPTSMALPSSTTQSDGITASELSMSHPSTTSNVSYDAAQVADILEELNYDRMLAHIPAMILISFLMIVGIMGNSLVVYVYRRRFKKTSSNYFILTMAVFDLLACLVGMPTELYDASHPYTFYSNVGCKLLRGCETFTIYGSAVVLVEIAFDRYFKICRPLMVVSLWRIRMLCGFAVVLAVVLSTYSAFVYGIAITDTPNQNIKGHDCSIAEEYKDSTFRKVYVNFLIILFSLVLIVLTALYVRIWVEIRCRRAHILGDAFRGEEDGDGGNDNNGREGGSRRRRFRLGMRYMPSLSEDESLNNSASSPNSLHHQNSSSCLELHNVKSNGANGSADKDGGRARTPPGGSKQIYKVSRDAAGPSTCLISNNALYNARTQCNGDGGGGGGGGGSRGGSGKHTYTRCPSNSSSCGRLHALYNTTNSGTTFRSNHTGLCNQNSMPADRQRSVLNSFTSHTPVRHHQMTRTTVSLFAVTIAFVLSYLPTIMVQLIRFDDKSVDDSQSFALRATLKVLANSFFINNAINPIIYSFLNVHFRRQARKTVEHIFCCCKKSLASSAPQR